MIEQLRNFFLFKTLNPKVIHCCEAPRSMLSKNFDKKQVLGGTFGEIWRRKKRGREFFFSRCLLKKKINQALQICIGSYCLHRLRELVSPVCGIFSSNLVHVKDMIFRKSG